MLKIVDIAMYILSGAIVVSLATSMELRKMHYENLVEDSGDPEAYESPATSTHVVVDLESKEDEVVKKKIRVIPKFMRKNSR